MSGLGLLKGGSRGGEKPCYRSSVDFSSNKLGTSGDDGPDDFDTDFVEDDSTTTMQSSQMVFEEVSMPADRVKGVMKELKYAVKSGASEGEVQSALASIQKLANTTYAVRSELGERGVCEGLFQLFERYIDNAEITADVLKALSCMLLSDDENKVRISKLGASKLIMEALRVHCEDPLVLELSCKLMVDLGNGKFVAMMEEDFKRKEVERDLRSRELKRQTLTPTRLANMSPTAAATARRALEELDAIEEMECESKLATARTNDTAESKHSRTEGGHDAKHRHSAVDTNECVQNEAIWDNRLDLCAVGACETLTALLHNRVVVAPSPAEHHPHLQDLHFPSAHTASTLLPSIFEDEDVVSAACYAVASLAANPVCCRRFARDNHLAKCLSALLVHFKHWNLMTASAWAVVNLCADPKSGNKERLGSARAVENLSRGLAELAHHYAEYSAVAGFDRLLEYYVWALLNLVIACVHNKDTLRAQEREPLFEQLLDSRWPKPGVKQKVRQIMKCLAK
jgi:hypothetical protein